MHIFALLLLPAPSKAVEPAESAVHVPVMGPAAKALSSTSGPVMEQVTENIAEHVIHIAALKMIFLIAAVRGFVRTPEATGISGSGSLPGSRCLVERRVPEPVVEVPLFFVTQYRIGFRDLFKLLLCRRIACIRIRMIFLRKFPVCLFNLCLICLPADAEHLVIISFRCHHDHLPHGSEKYPYLNDRRLQDRRRIIVFIYCSICNITAIFQKVKKEYAFTPDNSPAIIALLTAPPKAELHRRFQ